MASIYSIVYRPKDQAYTDERRGPFIRVALQRANLIAGHGIEDEALVRLGRFAVEGRLVEHVQRDRLDVHPPCPPAGDFAVEPPTDPLIRLHADDQIVGINRRDALLLKERERRRSKAHDVQHR